MHNSAGYCLDRVLKQAPARVSVSHTQQTYSKRGELAPNGSSQLKIARIIAPTVSLRPSSPDSVKNAGTQRLTYRPIFCGSPLGERRETIVVQRGTYPFGWLLWQRIVRKQRQDW